MLTNRSQAISSERPLISKNVPPPKVEALVGVSGSKGATNDLRDPTKVANLGFKLTSTPRIRTLAPAWPPP